MSEVLTNTTHQKKKRKLPRRPRLRDWPVRGYAYNIDEIIGDLPEWVETVGAEMRRCWDDMVGAMNRALKPIKEEAKTAFEGLEGKEAVVALQKQFDQRKREAIRPFRNTQHVRSIAQQYKGVLPSDCYYRLADGFMKVVQEAPAQRSRVFQLKGYAPFECGLPRFKKNDDTSLHLPIFFNAVAGRETTFADLYTEGGKVDLWRMVEASPFGGNCKFVLKQPQGSGARWEPIKLRIDFNRLPPMNAIVKSVTLIRRKEISEKWSIIFLLEIPPIPLSPRNSPPGSRVLTYDLTSEDKQQVILDIIEWDGPAVRAVVKDEEGTWNVDHLAFGRRVNERVCGYDAAGWRKFDDRIRTGVLTDNAWHSYEISVPLDMSTSLERHQNKYRVSKGRPDHKLFTWAQLVEQTEKIGQAVEDCKTDLREIFERNKAQWPESAQQSMVDIVKIRQKGIIKLRKDLAGFDAEACTCIDAWAATDAELTHWKRVFEFSAGAAKDSAFRKISVWLARNFTKIAWEGDKTMMKQLAESDTNDYAIKASQRYRQIAGQSILRLYVRQACDKWHAELEDHKAAYSTRICPVEGCGAAVPKSSKLILTCEQNHSFDQDVAASRKFLSQIEGVTSISAPPVPIPPDLRRYLRLMSVNESAIGGV
jgi:hypothetical protein